MIRHNNISALSRSTIHPGFRELAFRDTLLKILERLVLATNKLLTKIIPEIQILK